MYCKLAVEPKLHFHINSDIMNSIVLITWVSEVLLLLLLLLFFARGTCGENSSRTDTNRKPHMKSLFHLGPVSCLPTHQRLSYGFCRKGLWFAKILVLCFW